MGQELPGADRDTGIVGIANGEGEIFVDVGIEVEQPRLRELHDGGRSECLGNRSDVLQRIQAHRDALLEIGETVGVRPGDLVALDEASGNARYVIPLRLVANEFFKPAQSPALGAARKRCHASDRERGGPGDEVSAIHP